MGDSTVTDYLSRVRERLEADGFCITDNVTYKDQSFMFVAKRTRFQPEYRGFTEIFFIFVELSSIDSISFRQFSKKCFKYAMKSKSIPLPCGLLECVLCFPVALVDVIDVATTEAVRNGAPPKHFAAFEMPVICALKDNQIYYFERTPLWGQYYWDDLRKIIREMLSP